MGNVLGLTSKQFYGKQGKSIRGYQTKVIRNLKTVGYVEALAKLNRLHDKGADLMPIWADVIKYFQSNMQADFKAKQTPDNVPQRWAVLSPKYSKWKYGTKGRRIANLIGKAPYGGTLKRAVDGGPGWYSITQPTRIEFGFKGIPYAAAHQYGYPKRNLPARRFFLASGNKLPIAVVNYMANRIRQELQAV